MSHTIVKDKLSPELFKVLLMKMGFSDIAKRYGVSTQHVNYIYQEYVEKGMIDESFLTENIIACYNHFDKKRNETYSIEMLSFNGDTNKVLVSINNNKPLWFGIYKVNKGYYFRWSIKYRNKANSYRSYLDQFYVVNDNSWRELISNLENNIKTNKERL